MPRAPNDQGAEYQERSHTKDAKSQPKGRNSRTEPQYLKLVGIDYNIGLAAEDRLRRIFTILLRHAARDGQAWTEKDAPACAAPAKDHAGEET